VYSIQYYAIKCVSDLQQVRCFLPSIFCSQSESCKCWYIFFAIHLIVKIILKHVFFGAIKMKKVVSVSALKWIVRYIYYSNLHFLNNIIIIKTNAILPQTILFAPRDFKWNYLPSYFFEFEHSSWWLFRKQVTCTKWDTLSIFYCQTITDNGSDTSYKLTRSSQDIFLHLY
jgi:hypothetical protein